MKRLSILGLGLYTAFALSGCGGDTFGGITNQFAGDRSGTWSSVLNSETGTLTLVTSSDGTTTGTYTDSFSSETGVVTGTLSGTGVLRATADFPTATDVTLFGAAAKSADDVTISFTYQRGGTSNSATVVLTSGG